MSTPAAAPAAAPPTTPVEGATLAGYQLRLPSFEGPLDVLLRLIEREQLAIADVSLVAVTDQFLAYLEGIEDAPAATIAEFAAVAGRLVLLKSRSLMPRAAAGEEREPEDLVRQLAEYRALRGAIEHFASRDRAAAAAFAGGGGVVRPAAPPPRLALHPAGALARALRRRLTTAVPPPAAVGVRRVVTLREMAERVLELLPAGPGGAGWLGFGAFRRRCAGREEVLIGFLAVLSLVRRRVLEVEQAGVFGEIWLRRAEAGVPEAAPSAADD